MARPQNVYDQGYYLMLNLVSASTHPTKRPQEMVPPWLYLWLCDTIFVTVQMSYNTLFNYKITKCMTLFLYFLPS